MDKIIEAEVLQQKRKKTIITIVVMIVILIAAAWMLRSKLTSSVSRSVITTAVVEKGTIENTISASGEVLPEFEETITSPISASVQEVLLDAGSAVKPGQSILTLDKTAAQTEFEKLKFQLESKRNDIRKLRLQLDKGFYDIKSSNDIKQLRINSFEADVENAKRLFKAGGGTREDIEKAEQNLKVARLEKLQLENEISSKQQTMQVEMREAEIAAAIQENDLKGLERKLQRASIVASRNGVVTWVNKNIGAAIREGDALAKIADLSSFKVQGSISDTYLDQMHPGLKALIRINEEKLRGTIVNIQPSVQNSVVFFDIQLDDVNNKMLRPNMKVEVFLVTASTKNVLRVANGPAFKGAADQDIFIMKGNKAERRSVHLGMSNFDFVEIKDKVKPGDVIVTSDMSAFKNAQTITITD
ncbi:efflux RND transporter periplasmic adaptor subunit [Flavihumibacter profundi]|uniref:efflux RND transporter periplasmic adaptor subunit n=1 Tax=Flavihumibacter profundi TaxID=2716883 RepID=UPI001CC3EE86|nr:HlyD family efflux transporter periplasmic adaptor subunit [Flavihumibacter profundi]MBZ5858303.1 HlyD family efflux transporter periplasmic adaptor subunit [Flavihumibacter profundi]